MMPTSADPWLEYQHGIYVASSWRNVYQPAVVELLRDMGHAVYDFKNPAPGNNGFGWREIDDRWAAWTPEQYREALKHPIAVAAFQADMGALRSTDTCLLVLPAGRSASWELGWADGAGHFCAVYIPEQMEPELMYGGAGQAPIFTDLYELRAGFALCECGHPLAAHRSVCYMALGLHDDGCGCAEFDAAPLAA